MDVAYVEKNPILQKTLIENEHLNRDFEYEHKNSNDVCVVGRLKENISYWKNVLHASSFVLSIIEHGYYLPFTKQPTRFRARNNKSSLN